MATTIFNSSPGFAIAFKTPGGVPFNLDFDDWGGFNTRAAIVTGASLSRAANVQFLHTLRNFIYVYVFGERMGEMTITGLTFPGKCGANIDGFSSVGLYYEQKGVAFTGAPVAVQIGGGGFNAFLTGQKLEIVNPKARIGQFMLQFKLIPPENLV